MFSLTIFCASHIYSTRELAEKNAANWLKKNAINIYCREHKKQEAQVKQKFMHFFEREQYADCIKLWNEIVSWMFLGNEVYKVKVVEGKIDQPL